MKMTNETGDYSLVTEDGYWKVSKMCISKDTKEEYKSPVKTYPHKWQAVRLLKSYGFPEDIIEDTMDQVMKEYVLSESERYLRLRDYELGRKNKRRNK